MGIKRALCANCEVGYVHAGDNYCANCGIHVGEKGLSTKIKYCNIDQEYRVLLFVHCIHKKGATYYTDDKKDAEETAKAMIRDYKPT
jgi:hypothetical protein